jgi:hypothetical protein
MSYVMGGKRRGEMQNASDGFPGGQFIPKDDPITKSALVRVIDHRLRAIRYWRRSNDAKAPKHVDFLLSNLKILVASQKARDAAGDQWCDAMQDLIQELNVDEVQTFKQVYVFMGLAYPTKILGKPSAS